MFKFNIEKDTIDWIQYIKYLVIVIMVIGYLSTFAQANFIDIIVPGYMLLIIYTTINSNLMGYLNQFFGICFILVSYDLIWLFFASTVSSI